MKRFILVAEIQSCGKILIVVDINVVFNNSFAFSQSKVNIYSNSFDKIWQF